MLIELGKKLSQITQKRDGIARWGGEEFLVLLPETSLEQAMKAAERLRLSVEEMAFLYQEKSIRITISIGVTHYRPGNEVFDLVNEADKMLYAAKNEGRNRVVASV